jgi:hypothetical protein
MSHKTPHPQAGEEVDVRLTNATAPIEFVIEDWADRVWGRSWKDMNGNPSAVSYAYRAGTEGIAPDDEVLYGKVHGYATLVHASEILTEIRTP